MAHVQKPDVVFRRNGRVHLNQRGRQFSRLLAAEVCASMTVMLDTSCSVVVWRVLATHSIRQFPLHFPSHASPCAITFQLESTPLDEWLAYHRDLYLTIHNTHNRHPSPPPRPHSHRHWLFWHLVDTKYSFRPSFVVPLFGSSKCLFISCVQKSEFGKWKD